MLNHLVFADDIFLFCRGETKSVELLNMGLRLFSSVSGLQPNLSKSCCFFANVPTNVQQQILQLTGFQLGELPIKYLGLPLITSKLNALDCQPLLERFCAKIQSWTAKYLTFSGRLTLIKAILCGIFGYWSMHLFLSKSILKRLNSILFKFLWGGFYKPDGKCHYKVAWQDCCMLKSEGGLNIRSVFSWNNTTILFQVWRIVQPCSSFIWVRWFNLVLLQNKGFWTSKIPYKSSWGVRKILTHRNQALRYIKYKVGVNSGFRFWLDPWLNNRPLIWDHSAQAISNAESSTLSRISEYQCIGSWALPSSNYLDVMLLRQRAQSVQLHTHDHLTWDDLQCKISLGTIWNSIRINTVVVPWYDIVWNSMSIPRCSFITWLALKERLLTRDRMLLFHMNTTPTCLFCNGLETIQHIFSVRPYFDMLHRACPLKFSANWNDCLQGRLFAPNTSSRMIAIGSLFFTVAVYLMWKECNFRLHNQGQSHGSHSLIISLKTIARERLFSCNKFKTWVRVDPTIICMLY